MAAVVALSSSRPAPSLRRAGAAGARPQLRRPLLVLPARAAAGRPSPGGLACRALGGHQGGGGSASSSEEYLESISFSSLATKAASTIADAYKGASPERIASSRLAKWVAEVSSEGAQQAAGAAKDAGAGGVTGALKKAASVAASALGGQGMQQEHSKPWQAAAHYLGADSLPLSVDLLSGWLAGSKRKDDAKMVGALLFKMLQFYESSTGESFEGKDHQVSWVWHLAQELFGGRFSMRLVRGLVSAFLKVAS